MPHTILLLVYCLPAKEIQMNEYNLLILSERLLSLYANGKIVADGIQYTDEFKSLIGDLKDAVSNIE